MAGVTTMLRETEQLPVQLLDLPAEALHAALGGPTLFHLAGRREPPLFVSVLMHGNETTGWDAVRAVLRGYVEAGRLGLLPRAMSLFVGNTAAAAAGVRHLPGQPDYNRVWPGGETAGGPEHRLMAAVVERIASRGMFASIDIHNNTGLNPHYACVNRIDTRFLHLAAMFGRTVVYFVRPRGVASMAMAELGPSVTLECGKSGTTLGTEHAAAYVEACLRLAEHPAHPVAAQDVDLYHTVATVKVPPGVDFGFGERGRDLCFSDDLERLNFREVPAGTAFARVGAPDARLLDVRSEDNVDVAQRYFAVEDGELRLRCAVMPSMLTLDENVIRQDCLCYLMERYDEHLADAE
jgi:hypothetical protein